MSAAAARVCVVCGEPIRWGRRDRVTCSPACRQRRSERTHSSWGPRLTEGWATVELDEYDGAPGAAARESFRYLEPLLAAPAS